MKIIVLVLIMILSMFGKSFSYENINNYKVPQKLKVSLDKHFTCENQKYLALSIAFKETRFRNIINKTNREHSIGYFQLNLNTVDYINAKFGYMESISVEDLKNNIDLQTFLLHKHINYLMKRYDNNIDKVLRVYNGGVNGWKNTKDEYVEEVTYNYNKLIMGR